MASRRSPRWKAPPPKILATPESQRCIRCYATQGKAYIFHPGYSGRSTLVLINLEREVRYATRSDTADGWYCSDDVALGTWRVLGWIPCEGRLPHGDLEDVDPDLADFDSLPVPNALPPQSHGTRLNREVDIVPWDAHGLPEDGN